LRDRLKGIAFHSSGQPRGWLRFFLLKDQDLGTLRRFSKPLIFNKEGEIRPHYQAWLKQYKRSSYEDFMLDELKSGALPKAKTLCIVCTFHTNIIAEVIESALTGTRFSVTILNEMPVEFSSDLYIVVAPQMFKKLPPRNRCFMFQVEQVRASKWANAAYRELLKNSLGVLDYSTDNISDLIEHGLNIKQLYHVPIQPFQKIHSKPAHRDIDVLFYGAAGSKRREVYLNMLSKRFNLHVENNLFGKEMSMLLSRTKVAVNIHYYENALLETTRISEVLSHGASVVSETAVNQSEHDDLADHVTFVTSGDVDSFVDHVESQLSAWNGPKLIEPREDVFSTKFMLLRAFHGCGVLSFDEFSEATSKTELPSKRLVLGLPEEQSRQKSAQSNLLSGFCAFPALRHVIGWKGCAQSYKYIASKARSSGFNRIAICEDDAVFSSGASERLDIIYRYLDQSETTWDVFSGLLTDLHVDATISKVNHFESETLVHLNSVIGMVFGVYNSSAISILADFEFTGESRSRHTIDRYFEASKPRCVTTLVPLAMQSPLLMSTLWPLENNAMNEMIAQSQARLGEKVGYFLSSQAENVAE
jgi:GR25 family glycosyltransferase involved in LPS biosynthesis